MSETQAGPGWWMAADGRWYPPELAPPGQGRVLTRDQAQRLYAAGDRADDVMAALNPSVRSGPAASAPPPPGGRDQGRVTPGPASRCPRCGIGLQGTDASCGGCGAPVDRAAPLAPPAGGSFGGQPGGPYPPGYGEPVDRRSGIPLASLGSRLAAALIDAGLIVALYLVVAVAFAIADGLGILMFLAWLAVAVAMPVVGEGGVLGQTPGKCLMGIKVVGPVPGPIGYGRAVLRWVGHAVVDSPFVLCWFPLGLLWALWDGERRCWHDMLADTRVVIAPAGHVRSLAFWWRESRPGA